MFEVNSVISLRRTHHKVDTSIMRIFIQGTDSFLVNFSQQVRSKERVALQVRLYKAENYKVDIL